MLTLAPNRIGAESIAELARRGVLVSLGHSEASYEEARAAIRAGARAFHAPVQRDEPVGRTRAGNGRRRA